MDIMTEILSKMKSSKTKADNGRIKGNKSQPQGLSLKPKANGALERSTHYHSRGTKAKAYMTMSGTSKQSEGHLTD